MTRFINGRLAAFSAIVAVLSPSASVLASVATDLEGRAKYDAQSQMESRGYFMTSYHKTGDGSYQYWWSGSARNCVQIQMQYDRVRTTATVPAFNCNQYGNSAADSSGKSSSSGSDAGAAVALGALAVLGVAALASKSHHHEKDYTDSQQLSEFDRGFRDGIYHQSYSNSRKSDDYDRGYAKGVEQRSYDSDYRQR